MMAMEIPLLKASDIEARVQQVFNDGTSALLLLYKSARTDMRVLDEVFGSMNWKRTHECIDGNLFCTISVWDSEKKEWVSKQDVGVPSNRDAQKGQASDSFKRAGFNWGIGRELYDAPTIFVKLAPDEVYKGKLKSSVGFIVTAAEYDKASHAFTRLVITDRSGKVRWSLKEQTTPQAKPQAKPQRDLHEELRARLAAEGIDWEDFSKIAYNMPFFEISTKETEKALRLFPQYVERYKSIKEKEKEEIPL